MEGLGNIPENLCPGARRALLERDLASWQVRLVADEHDRHAAARLLAHVLQPPREVVERLPAGDVVHQQCAAGTPVLLARDRAVPLLPLGVVDRQLIASAPTLTRSDANSTPIVVWCSVRKRLSVNRIIKHDFPTPASPTII